MNGKRKRNIKQVSNKLGKKLDRDKKLPVKPTEQDAPYKPTPQNDAMADSEMLSCDGAPFRSFELA